VTPPELEKELDSLARFASIGRIRLETAGKIEEIPNGLLSIQRDEMITDVALKCNAILITADKNNESLCDLEKDIHNIHLSLLAEEMIDDSNILSSLSPKRNLPACFVIFFNPRNEQ